MRPRSVRKEIVASRSRTAMPTFSSLVAMRRTLPNRTQARILVAFVVAVGTSSGSHAPPHCRVAPSARGRIRR